MPLGRGSGGYGPPAAAPASPGNDALWVARSTAGGVTRANRLDTQATIDDWKLNDSTGDHISLDTALKPHASAGGSLKHAVLNSDGSASGQFSIPLTTTYGEGSVHWGSIRYRAPPHHAYQPWPPAASSSEANKILIISRDANGAAPTGSNQPNELVIQVNENGGMISGYWQDGIVTGNPVQIPFSSAVNGSDFRDQPSIDRGSNPLTGTNPDTGSAWSTNEQERARYGLTYGARSSPGAANYRTGLGDPFSGGFRVYPNEWITLTWRVEVGTWGTLSSRWTVWAARDGLPYEMLWDKQDIQLGGSTPYNGVNPLPYTTNRVAGGRKVSSRTSNIGGCTIHTVGLTTPVGDGTLEYNATTQRFRWLGAGESFGTARGFSAANDILWINVTSGAATESYVVVEITNPAALPSSGTVTDTVTIADGRNDTQVNYCDWIESTQPINSADGYPPLGLSVLADAAAGMASGDWLQLTGGNLPSGLDIFAFQGGASSIANYYANAMVWDAAQGKIYWVGSDHPLAPIFCQYDELTNAWTLNTAPNSTQFPARPTHAYNCNAFDTLRGKFYFDVAGSRNTIARWDGGGTWTDFNFGALIDYNINAVTLFYHAALDRLLHYQQESNPRGELVAFNPATGTFATLVDGSSSTLSVTGDPHTFGLYSPAKQIGWFGGGNGSSDTFTINAAGTVAKVTNQIPGAVGTLGPGSSGSALPVYNPATGNFIVIKSSTVWYDFNPTTETWTTRAGTIPMSLNAVIAAAIPEYGVVAFISTPSGFANAQMWLLKP